MKTMISLLVLLFAPLSLIGKEVVIGPDGFPENFGFTYAEVTSYYLEQVTWGNGSVYGPAVVAAEGDGRYVHVNGQGGEDILDRLERYSFDFTLSNPTESYVDVNFSLGNSYGSIFSSFRRVHPSLDAQGNLHIGSVKMNLTLRGDAPPLELPKEIQYVRVVQRDEVGNVVEERHFHRDERGLVIENPYALPRNGDVVVGVVFDDGIRERSYDIVSGVKHDTLRETISFGGAIEGVYEFSDETYSEGRTVYAGALIPENIAWRSPLYSIRLTSPRLVTVSLFIVDHNNEVVDIPTAIKVRRAGEVEWVYIPFSLEDEVARFDTLESGRYYVVFEWGSERFTASRNIGKGSVESDSTEYSLY